MRCLDRSDELGGRRVHRLPAFDDLRGAEAFEEPPVAVTGDDGDDAARCGWCVGHGLEETFLALVGLLVHVRDLDAFDRSETCPDTECASGIVRVDVHLQRFRVADDEQRVTELLHLRLDRIAVEVVAFDHERRAVAVLRELLMNRVDVQLFAFERRVGQTFAGDSRSDAAHDLEQTRSARVDDSRLAEDGELFGRARDGLLPAPDEPREQLRDVVVVRVLALFRQFTDDGEHRSLHRLAYGAIGGVARGLKGLRDDARVDRSFAAEHLRSTANDLRQDHAGVAARTHQRRARDFLDEPGPVFGVRLLELVDDGACGEGQVGAGVAVGNRVDVEVVDALAVAFERLERAAGELANRGEVAHAVDLFTSWIRTSTSATGSPVRRSTSYSTRFRSVDATSARLRPYSTTTLSSIVTPSSALPPTLIPCRSRSRVSSRSRGLRAAIPTTP